MRKEIIKTGDKYGRLTAIEFSSMGKNHHQHWLFMCDCGKKKVLQVERVKSGNTKSCGCLIGKKIIHGMRKTRIYDSWQHMKSRCLNKNNSKYKDYGGRGITICPEWLTFENFYKDMGKMPENKTLDRIKNNEGYCKSNCRWSTNSEQQNNTRRNHLITYKGKTQTVAQWSRELNIKYATLSRRLSRGMSVNKSLTLKL